jgi:hypothetical protein
VALQDRGKIPRSKERDFGGDILDRKSRRGREASVIFFILMVCEKVWCGGW